MFNRVAHLSKVRPPKTLNCYHLRKPQIPQLPFLLKNRESKKYTIFTDKELVCGL